MNDLNNLIKKSNKYVRRLFRKYYRISRAIKLINHALQLIIIVGAAIVPFVLNLPAISKVIPTIISGAVAVAAAITKYYKLGEYSKPFYLIAEKMEQEYRQHNSLRGEYSSLNKGAALDLYMDKIDQLIQEKNKLGLLFEKASKNSFETQDDNEQKEKEYFMTHQALRSTLDKIDIKPEN